MNYTIIVPVLVVCVFVALGKNQRRCVFRILAGLIRKLLTTKIYAAKINHEFYDYYFPCFEQIPSFITDREKERIRSAVRTDLVATYCKEEDNDCGDENDDI
jgi:hypothetical protein